MADAVGNAESTGFRIRSSIPVLRILDEVLARSFYVGFLGYTVDWEHRFRDDPQSPLYMQVSLGESILHLNGHADSTTPVSEVRIPVDGLPQYRDSLCMKQTQFACPEIVDPRYTGHKTDLNLTDPFGNRLVFWMPLRNADSR